MNKNIPTRIIGLLFTFAVSIALAGADSVFAHSRTVNATAGIGASGYFALFDGSGPDGTNRRRKGKKGRASAAMKGKKGGAMKANAPGTPRSNITIGTPDTGNTTGPNVNVNPGGNTTGGTTENTTPSGNPQGPRVAVPSTEQQRPPSSQPPPQQQGTPNP